MQQLRAGRPGGRLAVVVSCTATKLQVADSSAMVRNLPHRPDRFNVWTDSLERQSRRHRLRVLYGGPMWHGALTLESYASSLGYDVELWVASAGLGLSRADPDAPAYEASFSPGLDQVASERDG